MKRFGMVALCVAGLGLFAGNADYVFLKNKHRRPTRSGGIGLTSLMTQQADGAVAEVKETVPPAEQAPAAEAVIPAIEETPSADTAAEENGKNAAQEKPVANETIEAEDPVEETAEIPAKMESTEAVAPAAPEETKNESVADEAPAVEVVADEDDPVLPEFPAQKQKKPALKRMPKTLTGRDAVITASRTDYDRKEGVIFFDKDVYVDDEQYQLHADSLYVFLDGTNDLKRIVALGNVSMTNDLRSANCNKATYLKATGKIVLYGSRDTPAVLREDGPDEKEASGEKITFWLDSEEVNVERPVIKLPGSAVRGGGKKNLDVKGLLMGK
ncbi:MAG: hypothetical protein IJ802_05095 [Kiritimatiellae bacterium]|nr:hypothetical protein [Kiritimatiellia bacterium]